jgi:hypothetical protein
MKTLRLGGYAVCTGVALAMLAGCGGSNTQFNPPAGGVSAEQVDMRPAYRVVYSFKGGDDGANPFAGLLNVKGTRECLGQTLLTQHQKVRRRARNGCRLPWTQRETTLTQMSTIRADSNHG